MLGAATVAFLLGFSADFGGDKIIEVGYSDGSTSSIEAGRGIAVNGGVLTTLPKDGKLAGFEIQTTVGWKFTSTKAASNGSITWTRFPVEALAFWRSPENNYRVGGGLAAHFNNGLSGDGIATGVVATADNAVGGVIEANYFFGNNKEMSVGARYTAMTYQISGSPKINGNSYGATFTYFWPALEDSQPAVE